ncbi:nucleoside diphosphate-linked moiety X motif 17 isoform 2-T2 [Chlamydotis macqueenii]
MAGPGRLLVHVRRGRAGGPARFGQRPPSCPAKRRGGERAAAKPGGPGVAVAVATLLRASSGRVLLTRRASALRVFPNAWVPPGGQVEPGEELLDAGLRELEEETGLRLDAGTFSWRMLGLWESVYPPTPSRGPPRRHHIVAYLLLRSAEPHERLEARMRPSESEVSAYAWLEPPILEAIASLGNDLSALPATVGVTELSHGSSGIAQLPTATFLTAAPAAGDDVERVSTGTRFALRLWLGSAGERGPPRPLGSVAPCRERK